jgi:hypothetical protein
VDSSIMACESFRWKGRKATRLTNGIVEIVSLAGGGHLASLRFSKKQGRVSENVLWEAPWPTIDPQQGWSEESVRMYGRTDIGRFLAGYTGHALCLDYFGEPSPKSAALGASLHGEAAVSPWHATHLIEAGFVSCRWQTELPVSRLIFEREILLKKDESVAYVEETVRNEHDSEYSFDWVQHVTLGPPFLNGEESTVTASARRGITWPYAYEDSYTLAPDHQFDWPFAPLGQSDRAVDLRKPFSLKSTGFVAGLQLDPARDFEFITAVNRSSRLGLGYYFSQNDFPWMTVWEENCARKYSPWNGATQARGMEFGTAPLPLGEQALRHRKAVLGSQTGCVIRAGEKKTARYLIFLFVLPEDMHSIQDMTVKDNSIILYSEPGETILVVPADGAEASLQREQVA